MDRTQENKWLKISKYEYVFYIAWEGKKNDYLYHDTHFYATISITRNGDKKWVVKIDDKYIGKHDSLKKAKDKVPEDLSRTIRHINKLLREKK